MHLQELPQELFDLTNLTYLRIEKCPLRLITQEIRKLQNLTGLCISFTNITFVPIEVCQLKKL